MSGGSPAADACTDKRRWIERIEDESGSWGAVYHDDDGRLLGSMQFGPSQFFPRAQELARGTAER